MKLTFLGTGAASAAPLPFCRCPACRAARRAGGRDIRRRASLLVEDDLLIDLGPDSVQAMHAVGADLTAVRYLLTTHAHSDHFDAGHLATRMAEYACEDPAPLTIVASASSFARMSDMLDREEDDIRLDTPSGRARLRVETIEAAAGARRTLGRYTVTALPSRHDPGVDSRLYVVDDGTRAVLYATDTPALDEAQYALLAALPRPLDGAILDATYGPDRPETTGDHMNVHECAAAAGVLRARGLLAPGGQVWLTHISHEGTPAHDVLTDWGAARGCIPAWDGLTVTL